jgi:hypothetical protein
MQELHRLFGDRVQFVDLVVRQAHPGERHGGYRAYAEKLHDARRYQQEEGIGWPVVVDDLDGTAQRGLGGLSASAYLIDAQGRIAFYGVWGQSPALRSAIEDMLAPDGTGTLAGRGVDRVPHLAAAIVTGRGGPARGGRTALLDLELGFPGASFLMAIGWLGRPVLAPLVQSTRPRPARAGAALLTGMAAGTAWLLARSIRRLVRTATISQQAPRS